MQPFEHTTYSVGVIYLVLMNLPRHEHFKTENVILAGIIPGPSEPPRNINTYLSPMASWSDILVHKLFLIVFELLYFVLLVISLPAEKCVVSLVTNPGWDVINALRLLESVVLEFLMTTWALTIVHQEILLNTGE